MPSRIILHHFDASPFAEKVRLVMGIKDLTWGSVDIPMVMPKPQLMPLTGGYRKTPVLQIGAEVFCDTRLIMQELDRRFPDPPLYHGHAAGLATALASWSDRSFFEPGAGLSMGLNPDLPEPLLNDRKAFFNFMDFDSLSDSVPHLYSQFLAQVAVLETQLADGRQWVLGDQVSACDILAWFPLWMARGNFPQVSPWLEPFSEVLRWEQTMGEIGYGNPSAVSDEMALEVAKKSDPSDTGEVARNPEELTRGQQVNVAPDDYGQVQVTGTLLALDHHRLTIRRHADPVGDVNVHFPRMGYRVSAS